jgi:hypothetical protein
MALSRKALLRQDQPGRLRNIEASQKLLIWAPTNVGDEGITGCGTSGNTASDQITREVIGGIR